jgi:acetyltransferase
VQHIEAMSALTNFPTLNRRPPPREARVQALASVPAQGELVRARGGTSLLLRPIHRSDVAALQRGFRGLSPEEVRMRFLHPLTELTTPSAERLCDLDPAIGVAFVLIDPPPATTPEIHAVARAYIDPVTLAAEFAVVVQQRYAGQGFGRLLIRRVIDACRERGATELWGDVFLDNGTMLALCGQLGFTRRSLEHEPGVACVTLDLASY